LDTERRSGHSDRIARNIVDLVAEEGYQQCHQGGFRGKWCSYLTLVELWALMHRLRRQSGHSKIARLKPSSNSWTPLDRARKELLQVQRVPALLKTNCAAMRVSENSAICGRADLELPRQTYRARRAKRHAFRRPDRLESADRATWRPDSISALGRKDAAFKNVGSEGRASPGASRCRARVAQRRAVGSKAENASCATASQSQLPRKSRVAANGPESKVRCREVKASAASVEQPSGQFRPHRPSVRRSALLLRASKPRDRAVRKFRDRNRQQRPARPPEGVMCCPEVLRGAGKNVTLNESPKVSFEVVANRRTCKCSAESLQTA
jgi:hypothetical protein